MISLSGIVLTSLRLFEIGFCNKCCFKHQNEGSSEKLIDEDNISEKADYSLGDKPDSLSSLNELVSSNSKSRMTNANIKISKETTVTNATKEELQKESNDNFKSKAQGVMNNLSFSAMLIKSFLLENMFYIIQGINEIAKSKFDSIHTIT